MAKLRELLTIEEIREIENRKYVTIDLDKDMRDVTLGDMNSISLIIIGKEYPDVILQGVTTAKAIEILTDRAIRLDISIF